MLPLVIVGGGNSIRSFTNIWEDLQNCKVMTINHSFRFLKNVTKYQVSCDPLFWKDYHSSMVNLQNRGCRLVNDSQFRTTENISNKDDKILFTGTKKLSGIFALSYAVQMLRFNPIFLFGYDYGVIDGKTHFYDNVDHSGIGKESAYIDINTGKTREVVSDFNYFNRFDREIYTVGPSNIKAFENLEYSDLYFC